MEMHNLIPMEYEGKPIRVIRNEDGDPWFVAVDVCRVLGLDQVSRALARLDNDEKTTLTISTGLIEQGLSDNVPGTLLNLVNEPGLYALILTSRKPEAKAFKRWVTHEVLPSIRKTGSYVLPGAVRDDRPRLKYPHLLHGFPRGTTLTRITRMERELVGQGVHEFGLSPERARDRALGILREHFGADPAFLFHGLPIIVPEEKARTGKSKADGKSALPAPMVETQAVEAVRLSDGTIARLTDAPPLTATQVGEKFFGLNPHQANRMLALLGLQKLCQGRNGKKDWVPTEKAKPFVEWVDVPLPGGGAKRVHRWKEEPLFAFLESKEARERMPDFVQMMVQGYLF